MRQDERRQGRLRAENLDDLEALRAAVAAVPPAPPALAAYLDTVRTRAHAVTDRDVEELRRVGISEDEIFEQTVAAAVAEGLRRLDAAGRAIG